MIEDILCDEIGTYTSVVKFYLFIFALKEQDELSSSSKIITNKISFEKCPSS